MHTVLVVEDDTEIREIVAEILETDGYSVVQAANGREALDWLEGREDQRAPCLMLLDLMMPILSGPELLEIMAADAALKELPVVVVSAVCNEGSAPGVKQFLPKPVSAETLRRTVARYCPRS